MKSIISKIYTVPNKDKIFNWVKLISITGGAQIIVQLIGLVSDAFILNDYADASVYVIRQRHTLKKQLDYINDIYVNRRLNNVGIVLNDVKTGGKYGSSYGYGENYNYTYGEETKKKWWKKSPSTVGAS